MRTMPPSFQQPANLSVTLVLYCSDLELVARTLRSLTLALEQAREAGELAQTELIVLDNASGADYVEAAANVVTETVSSSDELAVAFIRSVVNGGFGAGHNRGLKQAVGDIHLILNPDVELDPDALAQGLAYLRTHPNAVLVAPRARGSDGSIEYLCKRYPSLVVLATRALGWPWLRRLFRRSLEVYELRQQAVATDALPVPLVSGCCMLVRSAALREVGGFDERYFLYFEDFDLSLRLHQWGEILMLPSMGIVHYGGYAARKGWTHVRLFFHSAFRFFSQHGWRWR